MVTFYQVPLMNMRLSFAIFCGLKCEQLICRVIVFRELFYLWLSKLPSLLFIFQMLASVYFKLDPGIISGQSWGLTNGEIIAVVFLIGDTPGRAHIKDFTMYSVNASCDNPVPPKNSILFKYIVLRSIVFFDLRLEYVHFL